MPNHYTNVLHIITGWQNEGSLLDAVTAWAADGDPCHKVDPMPPYLRNWPPGVDAGPQLDWAREHWGTKWGAYEMRDPIELPGDGGPVLLTFVTAWGPPNEVTRQRIAEALIRECGAGRVVWVGIDPSDDSHNLLGEWPPPREG